MRAVQQAEYAEAEAVDAARQAAEAAAESAAMAAEESAAPLGALDPGCLSRVWIDRLSMEFPDEAPLPGPGLRVGCRTQVGGGRGDLGGL
jgi:hypothetical protein